MLAIRAAKTLEAAPERTRPDMSRFTNVLIVLMSLVPTAAFAQASIAGAVKDTSGAVLPGVTVEAASPALIEKTRTVVTDGTGQCRIENLRPGAYTVTFTLAGFSTVKRDGVERAGSFTATVNADLRVGSVEETITVTAATPLVDLTGRDVCRQNRERPERLELPI
jgi:carboxypeptidase family protein